ncbi:MAG: hypothetical protein ACYDEA_00920 [Candidatus Dormibacteria bacterium]
MSVQIEETRPGCRLGRQPMATVELFGSGYLDGPEAAAAAIAQLRADLAARNWDRDHIDREVIARYGQELAILGLDEVGTEDLFQAIG